MPRTELEKHTTILSQEFLDNRELAKALASLRDKTRFELGYDSDSRIMAAISEAARYLAIECIASEHLTDVEQLRISLRTQLIAEGKR